MFRGFDKNLETFCLSPRFSNLCLESFIDSVHFMAFFTKFLNKFAKSLNQYFHLIGHFFKTINVDLKWKLDIIELAPNYAVSESIEISSMPVRCSKNFEQSVIKIVSCLPFCSI